MKRGLVLGAIVVVGDFLAAVGAAQQTPSAASIQVDKIRDNLYVLRGGGNTARFKIAKGLKLVDTKLPGWGRPILEKLKEITEILCLKGTKIFWNGCADERCDETSAPSRSSLLSRSKAQRARAFLSCGKPLNLLLRALILSAV